MDNPLTSGVTEGFGLMFYNARWYDPYITQFSQPDTIIPGGVQGLDRYAGMDNNPIRYNDPSGHMRTEGDLPNYFNPPKPNGLTSKGSGECTRVDNTAACDGERMFELYTWYYQTPGWWNNFKIGNFTPQQFLALIILAEANYDPELTSVLMEAVAHNLWGTGYDAEGNLMHTAYCESSTCAAGIFNFLGAYVQSAWERYNGLLAGNVGESVDRYQDISGSGITLDSIANKVIYNTPEDWKTYNLDDPVHWGSKGDPDLPRVPSNVQQGSGRCEIYYRGAGETVWTLNQAYTWSHRGWWC